VAIGLVGVASRGKGQSARRGISRFLLVAAAVSLFLSGSAAVWHEYLEDWMVAKRFGVVVPGVLYRSGQISPSMLEPTLSDNGIQAVIDLSGFDENDPSQCYEVEALDRLGIESHRIKLEGDGRGEIELFVQILKTIEDCRHRGRPVLVHCAAGTQRTGGVVAMYRLLVREEPPDAVMQELRRYGWRTGKDSILLDFLNDNMELLARRLREEGVIRRVPEPLPRLSDAAT
jgi:hypothetical protein